MRFLLDASLPRSAAPMLRQLGHEAADVRDIGMGRATDDVIALLQFETAPAQSGLVL